MKSLPALPSPVRFARTIRRAVDCAKLTALVVFGALTALSANAQTALADQPVLSATGVPGNLVLALSVEFPTAVTAADRTTTYSSSATYLGYFDPLKCYTYRYNEAVNGSYFYPDGTPTSGSCSGRWSGNFLNWATMQAVDPFRWALTGGYRAIDTPTMTILEKAWAPSNQGSLGNNFPNKSLTSGVSSVVPFSGGNFHMHVLRCGNRLIFNRTTAFTVTDCPTSGVTVWDGNVSATSTTTTYSFEVRVQVCVSGSVESNCVQYGSNYKPQGLIQQYASKIRYSAFGYLNDPLPDSGSQMRDGGVLRARMKFVGPNQPVPGSSPITNSLAEWSSSTGEFITNPDVTDATASSVSKSGVINYLNQFGLSAQAYKRFDPVSELYYAATRYLRNKGDVAAYSDLSTFNGASSSPANRTAMKDGFPVITNWTDPILYSCQKNFVLGIGDTNSNQDKNLPGNSTYLASEPSTHPTDTADIDVIAATNKVGVLEGMTGSIGATNQYNASNNSAYIAGLAYQFHTTDIRTEANMPGMQTIDTYWLDVLEGDDYKASTTSGRNQFYLAAKYGGFTVPTGYSYATNTTPLNSLTPPAVWTTNGETVGGLGSRPDNFFVANRADRMVTGLTTAFSRISNASAATTTSFATALPQVVQTGNASYSSKYDANNWSGEVSASELTFDSSNVPQIVTPAKWNFTETLATQLSGTGWNTARRVVSWNGSQGVAFRSAGTSTISASDQTLLDTSYTSGDDHVNYLNYLRGERSNEATATVTGYRTRVKLLGDIVGSKARPVGPPSFPFSDSTNAGYATFKSTWGGRRTVVYVGSNDGMMHAINGSLATTTTDTMVPGIEMFAYVPRALFQGPNNTPNVDGLASLGNPNFVHHYMVNATPSVYDVDFNKTSGASGTSSDWRSILIGGLGKGGKSYYAIDVTDPTAWTTETAVAGKVLWEFSNSTTGMSGELGYTFGDPVVVKTKKYGWVVIFPSGYDNANGQGYLLFVNPKTGALLERVGTGVGSVTASAGLAQANAFVVDATDGTADAVYAGDLLGNLWRFDVTAASGAYPSPTRLALLTAPGVGGAAQPVTSKPAIEIHPVTKKRYVMVGTGRLLDQTDITSPQMQTLYSFIDGTNAAFSAGSSFPIVRTNLANNSNALAGVTLDATTPAGWYEDLGIDTSTSSGWRIISDATTLAGSVAFASILPTVGDVCTPSGSSRVYGRDFSSGITTVKATVSGNLAPVSYVPIGGIVTDLRYLSVGGKATLTAGTDTGVVSKIDINPSNSLSLRRLNWRELQTVD